MTAADVTTSGKLKAMARDSVKTVIAASMIGTAIEFYDFYAYGTAAANYFPKVFFGDTTNPTVALLASLLTFAIAFIARPLGSLVFGHFGDRMGRKTTLVVSLLTMGVATFLIGCLPTYNQWGVMAVAVLCLCRFVQGIGLGGEWSGAALVATENAPEDKRALYGSFPELGAPIGFFLSNGTYFLLEAFNDDDAMLAWGWRVPFLLSAILVIVGLVVRVQMEETPIFRLAQEQKKVVKSPLTEVFKKSWKQVLQATFLVAVTYTLFYTLATWSLAWGTKTTEQGGGSLGFSKQEYLLMLMVAVCVFAAFIVISCVNADKFGRKRVIVISSCCLVAFALLFPFLLDGNLVGQRNFFTNMVFLCVGFALMGTAFGPIGAFLPELFDANVRYSGSGIGYNLAAIVGAAFVPTIATWLSHNWGVHSVGLYLGVMAVCCLVAVLSCKETKNVDFTK
ncbi:MAG: MFS transporter [Bifidobacterium merycicum]|uniref:Putative proline/betaine transporter n=2 Tax=Bifidobacterium merycicum TaxID=78345 RepID=A0A087BGB7_9BIFI|nr:MFS transporter [Bifidobacterium merycicum]MBQ1513926.1 MHS family MFS transporter [Bifidobacterium sp.]KFI70067.1 transmembrane transport protein [Bifidobacterium merycicum]MEE1295176.1 MFS transporter [Bifidobacterium merycicum]MEE3341493.1 MFS transporter [Bifidobacterium merycicum]SHE81812.1 metabolite-proton symporter [Bifidobacterium merycicum DSM 6492]